MHYNDIDWVPGGTHFHGLRWINFFEIMFGFNPPLVKMQIKILYFFLFVAWGLCIT